MTECLLILPQGGLSGSQRNARPVANLSCSFITSSCMQNDIAPETISFVIEGNTIRRIREAVTEGRIPAQFRPVDVNVALGITFAWTFLPKHRVGNPGGNTEHFVQISRGVYRLV